MATDTYWQLDKEYATIASDYDLIIRVIEHEDITCTVSGVMGTDSVPKKGFEFKVKREILADSSAYFRKLLSNSNFKEASQDVIDLIEDNGGAAGLSTWFKILHNAVDESSYNATTVGIDAVWFMLATAHKYELDPRSADAKAWFEKWYAAQTAVTERSFDYKEHQQLLFPCYTFDHAPGFRNASKYLVYRATGHITERRPNGFTYDHLRLDQTIIQQLNAAKGRLRTILHRNLYRPIEDLLKRARCRCKANVLYAYEQGLANTGAWPVETVFLNNSVERVLRMLEKFSTAFVPQTCGSGFCTFNFDSIVREARTEVKKYFDGLCLDCMSSSKPKLGDADEDYWGHASLGVHWDHGCRVKHQQPTWYFSFMGRKQKMVEWVDSRRGGSRGNSYGYGHIATATAGRAAANATAISAGTDVASTAVGQESAEAVTQGVAAPNVDGSQS